MHFVNILVFLTKFLYNQPTLPPFQMRKPSHEGSESGTWNYAFTSATSAHTQTLQSIQRSSHRLIPGSGWETAQENQKDTVCTQTHHLTVGKRHLRPTAELHRGLPCSLRVTGQHSLHRNPEGHYPHRVWILLTEETGISS